jgi:hypothetical protein
MDSGIAYLSLLSVFRYQSSKRRYCTVLEEESPVCGLCAFGFAISVIRGKRLPKYLPVDASEEALQVVA